MFKNYFKTAWRNLLRNKTYSLINISGLAMGIAAALLIFIVVSYELSYDTFQKNYHNIYRIVTDIHHHDGNIKRTPGIQNPAIDALNANFPAFIKSVPVSSDGSAQFTVLGNNADNDAATSKKFLESNKTIIFTQPSYFDVFNAVWLEGNKDVLNDPSSVVLNKTLATKYFGNWKNAPGQFLKLDNKILLKVNGVVEDAPENSDFPIIAFLSYEIYKKAGSTYNYSPDWGDLSSNNQFYVLLSPAANVASINARVNAFLQKQQGKDLQSNKSYSLQPLKDVHFDYRYHTFGDHSSNKNILLTLALIGMLIIRMASINYINLATVKAITRSKEAGIRKILGGTRSGLIIQVLSETFIVVLSSTLIALFLAKLFLPYLSDVATMPNDIALLNAKTILFLSAITIGTTIISGIYPAAILSRFHPIIALKNKMAPTANGGISLRRILVVTQFAIAQMLLIGTIVAVSQMNYVQNADLGFNSNAVIVLPAYSDSANLSHMKPLKQQLLQITGVVSVSYASDEPSSDNNSSYNFSFAHKDDEGFSLYTKNGDEDYIKTFGLHLIAGRNIAASDTLKELVVNETLLKKLGVKSPENAIGKDIRIGGDRWYPIVGVVKDFKTNSLREKVKPLAIFSNNANYSMIALKLKTKNMAQTVSLVQKIWKNTYPEYAFTSHFTDETIARFYSQETRLALLYKIFAGIAIFISCLGLYGLVSYMAVQKTKEIGIRKVLGAGISNIVVLFSKEFVWLIITAFFIAVPVAYYFTHNWLQGFAYRITMGIGVFAAAIIVSLAIALLTVGYRAVKAALANPVKSLRSE